MEDVEALYTVFFKSMLLHSYAFFPDCLTRRHKKNSFHSSFPFREDSEIYKYVPLTKPEMDSSSGGMKIYILVIKTSQKAKVHFNGRGG
jgi:hypothetical protein